MSEEEFNADDYELVKKSESSDESKPNKRSKVENLKDEDDKYTEIEIETNYEDEYLA